MPEINLIMAGSGGRSLVAEFYSHVPEKRWVELKEELYARLHKQKTYLDQLYRHKAIDLFDDAMVIGAKQEIEHELKFLRDLIDKMERS